VGHDQFPAYYDQISGDVYLAGFPTAPGVVPVPPAVSADPDTAARRDYELAAQISTKEAWDAFLARHPSGYYADLARIARGKLAVVTPTLTPPAPPAPAFGGAPTTAAPPALTQPAPIDPCALADDHWRFAESMGLLASFEDHLARFPNCAFAGRARARIEHLRKPTAVVAPPVPEERQKVTVVAPPVAPPPPDTRPKPAVVVPPVTPATPPVAPADAALPRELTAAHQVITVEAHVPAVQQRADAILAQGRAALERGNAAEARAATAQLDQLAAALRQEYVLRIAGRPQDQTGFFREHARYQGRAYFLVVDAIDPQSKPVQLPIHSYETNKTETVSRFAVRVPQETFDAVRADKQRNGLVQNARMAEKRRGFLEPEFRMQVLEGRITRW
jgi:hypothetical protein